MSRVIVGKFGTRIHLPGTVRRFRHREHYPYVEVISNETNRAAAKLKTRDGTVVRSFFGTIRQAELMAQSWWSKYQ